jgi:hypothetical protein
MPLSEQISEYVRACFTGLWIVSHEHQDALFELAALCQKESWQMAAWDIESGLTIGGQSADDAAGGQDPLAAVRSLAALGDPKGTTILVLQNFHPFLRSHEVIQALVRQILAGKQNRTFVVVLAPVVAIPVELEKLFVVVEHDLPDRRQLAEIARGIATEKDELPKGQDLERVLDAAAGLTRYEAEGAFSLALVRHGRIEPSTLWQLKSQTLLKSGLLSLHRGGETFADLGGLESLKAFCLRALRTGIASSKARAHGVMLLGVPGTGKSAFAKALGNETGRPTVILDVGSLMGSLVGQSEERTRQALKIIDAMQPAVVMLDEVDKALSGAASGGSTDSGVSARMFGTLLSWLNDHESDVFVVCTANDVSRLPPEFSRSERFDGVFFLDLPGEDQREAIWQQYIGYFELDAKQRRPDDANWTGAEIKSCCRLAALLDLPLVQAAQNVVPVAVTAAESVERLRTWASGRCLAADRAGIYQREKPSAGRRRIARGDASNN